MDDAQLAAALAGLGRHVEFPQLSDLRPRILQGIARPRRRQWWRDFASPRYRFAPAVVTFVLLLAALLASSPAARAVAEEILRLPGVVIFRGTVPSATPSPTRTPGSAPSATSSLLSLGERVSLDEARRRAGYPLLVPTDPLLGAPDEVYVRTVGAVTEVSFVYATRAGIPVSAQAGVAALVSEFDNATIQSGFFGKIVGPDTRVEAVVVNGGNGFWLEGRPHGFFYQERNGASFVDAPLRLAGNTLIWEQAGLIVRIEAQVDKATALRIASSLR